MEHTVVGVYDSYTQARDAMNELIASGFSHHDVQLNPDQEPSAHDSHAVHEEKHESGIGAFFRSLFGMDDGVRENHDVYSEAVRRGSCVLAVNADSDEQRDRATEIMNRYHPVDVDERSSHWRSQGWTGYDASKPRMTDDEIQQERSRYAAAGDDSMYAQGRENTMNLQGDERGVISDNREATMLSGHMTPQEQRMQNDATLSGGTADMDHRDSSLLSAGDRSEDRLTNERLSEDHLGSAGMTGAGVTTASGMADDGMTGDRMRDDSLLGSDMRDDRIGSHAAAGGTLTSGGMMGDRMDSDRLRDDSLTGSSTGGDRLLDDNMGASAMGADHLRSDHMDDTAMHADRLRDDSLTGSGMSADRLRDDTSMHATDGGLRDTGETQRIPVVQEDLQVGKREVQRGGVRVFQRVRETPVNEEVQLREEQVHVERHPVDRPASEADLAAFKEGTVEMREMAEEAVLSKTARVVEEVEVGKEVRERTEQINDTVRRTEVDVEQLGAEAARHRDSLMPDDATLAGRDMDLAGRAASAASLRDADAPTHDWGHSDMGHDDSMRDRLVAGDMGGDLSAAHMSTADTRGETMGEGLRDDMSSDMRHDMTRDHMASGAATADGMVSRNPDMASESMAPAGMSMGTGDTSRSMMDDSDDYRRHWQSAYGQSGGRYEDYDSAYRYGSTMGGTERFRNYRWEEAEPELRSDWERSHPESTWERVKDAVRYGAERVTGNRHH
ncbi:conserved domain-containing protein [Noviherbaspirillum humi]|uniref:Conserved domain-containing protein n=1 Tax=Noviherbaspirillum humi TaxID=1688639 RepID=A0A239BX11_9BURK|nr:conserved domain-containing protein [Noviherbaspirillum humi]